LSGFCDQNIKIYQVMPKNFSPVVEISVLWIETPKGFLFLQKNLNSKNAPNSWAPPGGTLEKEENSNKAAIRELFEETGIVVKLPSIKLITKLYIRKKDHDFTYYMYDIKLNHTPDVKLSVEHQNYAWLNLTEAKKLFLMSGVLETIKIYESLKTSKSFN
jgi:8-oxo-dGTP diphosphatase